VPEAVPVQLRSPVPVPEIEILPVGVPQAVGSFTVPRVISGLVFTDTEVAKDVAEQPFPFVKVTA
jgi:hypothetical protein